MLRNDLITLLGERDNDNVAVKIGDVLVDVDGVTTSRGNIELILAPDDVAKALHVMAPPGEGTRP